MERSWELSDDQRKAIQERQREIGAQFDPETGRRKGQTENTGDGEDAEAMEGMENRGRKSLDNDESIR